MHALKNTVEVSGFEPETFRMRSGHSTTELHPRLLTVVISILVSNFSDPFLCISQLATMPVEVCKMHVPIAPF